MGNVCPNPRNSANDSYRDIRSENLPSYIKYASHGLEDYWILWLDEINNFEINNDN